MTRRTSGATSAQVGRHLAEARHAASSLSTLKKLLMTCMVIGAMGTAVSAGTFASYTAQTKNSTATVATGTLVLTDQVESATACISRDDGATPNASVDVNANANCDLMFDSENDATASSKRPGEGKTVAMHLKNAGSLSGTLSISSQANCSEPDPAITPANDAYQPSDQPVWYGTNTNCGNVQVSIADATTCYYGDNMGTSTTKPYITGAPLTYPVTITAAANKFKLTVDGSVHDNLAIAASTYTTAALFANQINSQITTWATATATGTGQIKIESKTATGSSNVTLGIPSSNADQTGLLAMGFMDGSSAAGPGICAVKTGDRDHTLDDFRTTYATVPLSLGIAGAGVTRDFNVTLAVPAVITDEETGRRAYFEMTWGLT
jgi:hypothetical protein